MLSFVPLSAGDLASLAGGGVLTETVAFVSTPAFRDAFGLGPSDDEDAERTLLYLAALAALQQHGRRLVGVADCVGVGSGEYGRGTAPTVAFGQLTALFADDPDAAALVADAAAAVAGLDLGEAWDAPAHERLLQQADLLWFGPEEWATLVTG